MLNKNEDSSVLAPAKWVVHLIEPRPIDRWGNVPTRGGKDCNGIHRCPKGPQDASSWVWISHQPSIGAERWKIIPWQDWFAIRYEPVGWECRWCIVGIYFTIGQAREAMEKF